MVFIRTFIMSSLIPFLMNLIGLVILGVDVVMVVGVRVMVAGVIIVVVCLAWFTVRK